jgi:hypothetical protein
VETEGICEGLYRFWEELQKTRLMEAGEEVEREEVSREALKGQLDRLAGACKIGASEEADRLAGELDRMRSEGVREEALKEISGLVASLDYDVVVEKVTALKRGLGIN